MFQWLIDFFDWFGNTWKSIFDWIGSFFESIVNWIDSLFSAVDWINSVALIFPAFQIILTTLGIAFALTIVLKILNR